MRRSESESEGCGNSNPSVKLNDLLVLMPLCRIYSIWAGTSWFGLSITVILGSVRLQNGKER
jgi:hypothetical protein